MKPLFFLFILLFFSCKTAIKQDPQPREMETCILLHSPMGIRAEYNIDQKNLELWISPQSGKTTDIFYRNFSNRDDHTSIFDRISFPELDINDFDSCSYDPFHSKVYFKNQVLHIAMLWDKPSIILWCDKPEMVDLKTDKADILMERTGNSFITNHPDRGLEFCFAAILGKGEGTFQHQLVVDKGRSTYARAHLSAMQPLFIAGELKKENISQIMSELIKKNTETLLLETNQKVDEATKDGRVLVKNNAKLQHLLDVNRRVWVSIQDHSGALKSSVKSIYYLIWVREGGLACPLMASSGWVKPLEMFNEFNISTPTIIEDKEFSGLMYGQLCNPKINKWEEDGTFYTIWSAFTHWTQTGDDKFIKGKYLASMEASMDWLERYSFDKKRGLFFRYYYCETPLKGSRDYGWDNAVGNPESRWEPATYKGNVITKSYDVYINLLNYNCYLMLSAMNTGEKSLSYLDKAKEMEPLIQRYFRKDSLPYYGELVTEKNDTILADPYGLDETDYEWALTLCPFYPDLTSIQNAHSLLFKDLLKSNDHYFLAAYFSIINALDINRENQDNIMEAVNHAAEISYKPWKYLPLSYAMGEMSYETKPGSAHYIRPQMFTIGSWLGAMGNLAIKRLPLGFAVRDAKYVEGIENYQYLGSSIDIKFKGEGSISSVILNDEKINNTLQIPVNKIQKGKNSLVVEMSDKKTMSPLLLASSLRLTDINSNNNKIIFMVEAIGNNYMEVKNARDKKIMVLDNSGNEIKYTNNIKNEIRTITFDGIGKYQVLIQ